jgi:hypothetical protein
MQLKLYALLSMFCFTVAQAQQLPLSQKQSRTDDFLKEYPLGEVEVDILSSYYEQDGNHSAVEGGEGTQALTDKSFTVIVNIPVDTVNILNMSISADTYTSASSDHIDGIGDNAILSTASSRDTRKYGNLSYSRINKKGTTLNIGTGFSSEFDVQSGSVQMGISKESENRNREISLHLKGYYDKWKLIYPVEYRYNAQTFDLPDIRKTLSADVSVAQVINTKLQAMLSYEFTYQNGLLSTPFHRVYFNDGTDIYTRTGSIEKLPESRTKHAFGVRMSAYPFDWLIGRFYTRYYFDSFGINSYTISSEFPVKINRFFSVYPFYRYYTQTSAKWFSPYGEHDLLQDFYTSDYDLAGFSSNKAGVGLRISPPFGLLHYDGPFRNRTSALKGIEIRCGKYFRSDGLESFIMSANLNFGF